MGFSEQDVRKALHVLVPEWDSYDLEILIIKHISGLEDYTYDYQINQIKKNGKKVWLLTYRDKDIQKALDSLLKIYGYCRPLRPRQSIDRQIKKIKNEYAYARIIQDEYSEEKTDRPEWSKLLDELNPGDTIVFDSLSVMSSNAEEGIETYFSLYEKGINLVFLNEHYIDTAVYSENLPDNNPLKSTADNKILRFRNLVEKQIHIAFDQVEREAKDLKQRTKKGIETARLNGKQIGQKPGSKLDVKKKAPAKEKILKYNKDFNGSLDDPECIKLVGISRNTYYKYKKELRYENSKELTI